jgi:hypothetical protein
MFHLKNLSAGYPSNYFSTVAVEEERAAQAARRTIKQHKICTALKLVLKESKMFFPIVPNTTPHCQRL